jgi:16S rRNA (guanine527-N7)-methyltransferase
MTTPTNIVLPTLFSKSSLGLSQPQVELIERYVSLLLSWNQKINLVSRKSAVGGEEDVWERHIVGSISFLAKFELEPNSKILDLGTGGGLPGIPLAILMPDSEFMLVDSIQKKITAVSDILENLHLPNVKTCVGRAEDLSQQKEFHLRFDYVIARAVAPIKDIINWGKPFLKPIRQAPLPHEDQTGKKIIARGSIVMLKGGDLTDEISAAKIKCKPVSIEIFDLPSPPDSVQLVDKKLVIVFP